MFFLLGQKWQIRIGVGVVYKIGAQFAWCTNSFQVRMVFESALELMSCTQAG